MYKLGGEEGRNEPEVVEPVKLDAEHRERVERVSDDLCDRPCEEHRRQQRAAMCLAPYISFVCPSAIDQGARYLRSRLDDHPDRP